MDMERELLDACRDGELEEVKSVVRRGCDPKTVKDYDGSTRPLHIACGYVPFYHSGNSKIIFCLSGCPVKNYGSVA